MKTLRFAKRILRCRRLIPSTPLCQPHITNKQQQQQIAICKQRIMPVMFEFSPENRFFQNDERSLQLSKDFQNRTEFEKSSRHWVGISQSRSPKNICKCNILESKTATNRGRQIKQREQIFYFTCVTRWVLFSFNCCWSAQNRNHIFFDKNPR